LKPGSDPPRDLVGYHHSRSRRREEAGDKSRLVGYVAGMRRLGWLET
jgi:hypothetical protein